MINISLVIENNAVKESDRLKAELEVLNETSKELQREAEKLETRLEAIKRRYREINGSYGSWSEIKELQRKIDEALLLEQDEELPAPIMANGAQAKATLIISRITPKRIYVRERGNPNEEYYDKITGKPNYSWRDRLDVDATIAAWEAYKAASKVAS